MSFRRKPEPSGIGITRNVWIPACAGMTEERPGQIETRSSPRLRPIFPRADLISSIHCIYVAFEPFEFVGYRTQFEHIFDAFEQFKFVDRLA